MRNVLQAAAAVATALAVSGATSAKQPADEEALISAAVVYNIARFSTWPDEGRAGERFFEICFDQDSGMADAFATIAGKEVSGRPVRPVPIDVRGAWDQRCHVYFTTRRDDDVLSIAIAQGSLTIGRDERFLRSGGAVRLRIEGKPRFSVNVRNAHAAGVYPSSKLLRLAEEVVE